MEDKISMIAQRISLLREIADISVEQMAEKLGITCEEYMEYERGEKDFAFSFLYTVSGMLGVDIVDILTGEGAKLSKFSLVRNGEGLSMQRRKEYKYQHIAYFFKHKKMEPFLVLVEPSDVNAATHKNRHDGQEINYVLEGSMTVFIDEEQVRLYPGDTLYFDASNAHAMQAEDGKPCRFLSIIAK